MSRANARCSRVADMTASQRLLLADHITQLSYSDEYKNADAVLNIKLLLHKAGLGIYDLARVVYDNDAELQAARH